MASLEDDAKPPLAAMIGAQGRVTLEPSGARIVGAWLLKTAMVIEQVHTGPRVVPASQRRHLAGNMAIPARVQAWIGMRAEPRGHVRWDHGAWGQPVANGYMILLAVGALSAFLLSPPHEEDGDPLARDAVRVDPMGLSDFLVPLTDSPHPRVTWPPRWSVPDDALDEMFVGFTGRPL